MGLTAGQPSTKIDARKSSDSPPNFSVSLRVLWWFNPERLISPVPCTLLGNLTREPAALHPPPPALRVLCEFLRDLCGLRFCSSSWRFAPTNGTTCPPTQSQRPTTNDQRLSLMPRRQQIHIQPHRSRHPRRQLPEERISRIDVRPLPILRHQQPTLLFGLPRIVRSQQRREMRIP